MTELLLAPVEPTTETVVRMTLFGAPQLRVGGQTVALPRRQMRALLYRLAAAMQPVAREQLCFLLWPDTPEATARRYLTVLLNQLRQSLPAPNVLLAQRDAILLNPALVEVDTVRLSHATAAAAKQRALEPLGEAVELYEGPFLDGFTLPASPEFDAWADQERQHWERRYLDALALLVDGYAAQAAYPRAIAAAQRALQVDELAEDMHRRLIELYGTAGDRAAALRQFERCVVVLERELGVGPLPETRAAYENVRDGRAPVGAPHPALRVEAQPSDQASAPATRLLKLPAAPTPLLGRAEEQTYASAMLIDPTVRLLTLCGPGGCGKTRLAQQIAWDVADLFADGALFVPLAALRNPALVVSAIASMCELNGTTIAALVAFLRDKHMLLVLDNCEHLLEAAPDIAALLEAAPQLHILATSRAALSVQGEHAFQVPPLPLPDLAQLPPLEALADVPSVALLLARTQALNPRFQLREENAADLAAICVRLDGLPLGIELAAARLKLLPPRDLLRRLDRRLAVLGGGPRDLPDRQQTLRATIDWSYRLLNVAEQVWFERCSMFAGGWTLHAAEGVHERLRWPEHHASTALDALSALADKSLIQISNTEQGEIRFGMLETIREFAAERLHERGTFELTAQAHADQYVHFVAEIEQTGLTRNTPEWVRTIKADYDNIRAALRWHVDHNTIESALELGTSLSNFWYWREYEHEGLQWLKEIVAQSQHIRTPLRAKIMYMAGLFSSAQGEVAQSIALYNATLPLCRELGLTDLLANSIAGLGISLCRQGDFPAAIAILEESVALARTTGNPRDTCVTLRNLAGVIADYAQDLDRAVALYEETLVIAREVQRPVLIATALAGMGIALTMQGKFARAAEMLEEALQLERDVQAESLSAWTMQYLGMLRYLESKYQEAREYFLSSLAIAAPSGSLNTVPMSFEGLAGVAATRGRATLAARLLGAAETLRERLEITLPPLEQPYYHRILGAVREQLAETPLREAWNAGRKLTLEQALAEAKTL